MVPPAEGGSGAGPGLLEAGPEGAGPCGGRGCQGGARAGAGPGRSSPEARWRTSLLHGECWGTSGSSLCPASPPPAHLLLPPGRPPPPPPLYDVPDAQAEDAGVVALASGALPASVGPVAGRPAWSGHSLRGGWKPSDALAPGGPACGEFPAGRAGGAPGWAPAGGGRCWAGPGGSPGRRRPGRAGWGAPAAGRGDPRCHGPGQEPGGRAGAAPFRLGVCARGGCGAKDVRDFFFLRFGLLAQRLLHF